MQLQVHQKWNFCIETHVEAINCHELPKRSPGAIPPALLHFFSSFRPIFEPASHGVPTVALPILRICTLLWYVGRSGLLVVGDRLLGGGGRLWVGPLSAITLAAWKGTMERKQRKISKPGGLEWNSRFRTQNWRFSRLVDIYIYNIYIYILAFYPHFFASVNVTILN